MFETTHQEYNAICNKIRNIFIAQYFKNVPVDMYWVGGEVGEVTCINDHFFSLTDMIDYMKYKYSVKKMFEHSDYAVACYSDDRLPVNIKNYKKLK